MSDPIDRTAILAALSKRGEGMDWGIDEAMNLIEEAPTLISAPAERILFVPTALIAIDDAAAAQDAFNVDQQLARAQAYATLASVEQARIANLIAWKALQTAREARGIDALPLGGDEITEQIEEGLGL